MPELAHGRPDEFNTSSANRITSVPVFDVPVFASYYETLQSFDHQHVKHEGALRSAFQTMLADTARTHHWTLVPELSTKAGGKRVVPDGTMRDPNSLPCGYLETKDSDDDQAGQ